MSKKDVDEFSGTETTGHEWDGIKELNTPLPPRALSAGRRSYATASLSSATSSPNRATRSAPTSSRAKLFADPASGASLNPTTRGTHLEVPLPIAGLTRKRGSCTERSPLPRQPSGSDGRRTAQGTRASRTRVGVGAAIA